MDWLDDTFQLVSVGVVLVVCILWIGRRLRRRHDSGKLADDKCGARGDSSDGSGCQDCPLSEHCKKR